MDVIFMPVTSMLPGRREDGIVFKNPIISKSVYENVAYSLRIEVSTSAAAGWQSNALKGAALWDEVRTG
jgi:ABC-type phosphate transport system ATPase subunit